MTFDVLIIGGGAAGLSCALVLGSARNRDYVADKSIGIITHQKGSHLQNALFNNVLGLEPGTTGSSILKSGKSQLNNLYPHVRQLHNEKVRRIKEEGVLYQVETNRNMYLARIVVVAAGYTNLLTIKGLENYIEPHPRAAVEKNRIWLKNQDHLIKNGLYVAGTLAGWRSQFAMASGSG
ncbi:MAG: NAD(P)/FAD-dependent oxidoreductase, partial [Flavobacteriaceae bacterium]|nr:NAD(P)/FAD-dependent oxidoreductase [Flavobacteriaceae bacterium]